MKVELNGVDRLLLVDLLNLYAKEGTVATVRMVRDLKHRLGFSADELEQYGITEPSPGRFEFKDTQSRVTFSLAVRETELILDTLNKHSEAGKVSEQFLSLYDIFVPDEPATVPFVSAAAEPQPA